MTSPRFDWTRLLIALLLLAIVAVLVLDRVLTRQEQAGRVSSPASSQAAPPPASGPAPAQDVVDIRFQDIMAGIVWMDSQPALRLSREQARRMTADVRTLAQAMEHLWQLQMRMNAQFRADQWTFIHDRRWDTLTRLDVPVPAPFDQMPDPIKTVRWARAVAEAAAAGPSASGTPVVLFTPRTQDGLSWFHLSQGTVLFSARYPDLVLSAEQGRALTPLFTELERIIGVIEAQEKTLVPMFSEAQRAWILEQKNGRAAQMVDGRPILDGREQPSTARVVEVVEARAK